MDAFGLRFEYFWCSEFSFFPKKQKATASKKRSKYNSFLTICRSQGHQKLVAEHLKTCLGPRLGTNTDFSSILVPFGLCFGPFWASFWCPLAPRSIVKGTRSSKGASRAPPGTPPGPQGSTKAPPRPLRPRPGHQNDPSGINFEASGPPFGLYRLRAAFGPDAAMH